MPELLLTSSTEAQTQQMGASLGAVLEPGSVVILSGDLGAGKTQFTKGIARALGIIEPITSPTFNILLVHEAGQVGQEDRLGQGDGGQGAAGHVASPSITSTSIVSKAKRNLTTSTTSGCLSRMP